MWPTFSASRDSAPAWRLTASISASISICWLSCRACRTRSLATSRISSLAASREWPGVESCNTHRLLAGLLAGLQTSHWALSGSAAHPECA